MMDDKWRVRRSAIRPGWWTVDRLDPDHHGAGLEGWRAVRSFPSWLEAQDGASGGGLLL